MAFPERRTADVLLTILFFAVVCAALYSARRIILIFVLAVFFAYLIDPVVKFLLRHSLSVRNLRGPAVVEVYLAFVILIAALGYALAPGLARNTVKLVDEVPALLDGLSTGDIAAELGGKYGWSEQQEFRFRAFLARHRQDVQGLVRSVDHYLSNAAQVLGWLVLIPVLAIFFLRDGDHIADVLIQMFFSPDRRPGIRAVANELHIMLTRYIRAQVLLCGLSFVFYAAAMLLLRFPHAMALAVLGGSLEFIPAVGWVSTLAAIISVGVVNHAHWIWMAALLAIWRLVQDYFASPRIMGRHLEIHPLAAIFAVLVGGEIGGIVGIYLAVPLMASMRVIWRVCAGPEGNYQFQSAATAEAPPSMAETAAD
ncbi:MAG: AI-2E family transporter [Terracidiphilus sp.]